VGDALVSRHDGRSDRKWAGPRIHRPPKANSQSKTKQEWKAKHEWRLDAELCML